MPLDIATGRGKPPGTLPSVKLCEGSVILPYLLSNKLVRRSFVEAGGTHKASGSKTPDSNTHRAERSTNPRSHLPSCHSNSIGAVQCGSGRCCSRGSLQYKK